MNIRESYSRALEQGALLTSRSSPPSHSRSVGCVRGVSECERERPLIRLELSCSDGGGGGGAASKRLFTCGEAMRVIELMEFCEQDGVGHLQR